MEVKERVQCLHILIGTKHGEASVEIVDAILFKIDINDAIRARNIRELGDVHSQKGTEAKREGIRRERERRGRKRVVQGVQKLKT